MLAVEVRKSEMFVEQAEDIRKRADSLLKGKEYELSIVFYYQAIEKYLKAVVEEKTGNGEKFRGSSYKMYLKFFREESVRVLIDTEDCARIGWNNYKSSFKTATKEKAQESKDCCYRVKRFIEKYFQE